MAYYESINKFVKSVCMDITSICESMGASTYFHILCVLIMQVC